MFLVAHTMTTAIYTANQHDVPLLNKFWFPRAFFKSIMNSAVLSTTYKFWLTRRSEKLMTFMGLVGVTDGLQQKLCEEKIKLFD